MSVLLWKARTLQRRTVNSMGDKSPKAKDKAKKQDSKQKDQKSTDAKKKAAEPGKKK